MYKKTIEQSGIEEQSSNIEINGKKIINLPYKNQETNIKKTWVDNNFGRNNNISFEYNLASYYKLCL